MKKLPKDKESEVGLTNTLYVELMKCPERDWKYPISPFGPPNGPK